MRVSFVIYGFLLDYVNVEVAGGENYVEEAVEILKSQLYRHNIWYFQQLADSLEFVNR